MFYRLALLTVFIIITAVWINADETASLQKNGWDLTWRDEFDNQTIDLTKWTISDSGTVYNNELEYYAPDEAYIDNGNLVMRSQKRIYKGKRYTSARLTTKGKFFQQYGLFEIRAKLPKTQGIWPAHWLMPESGAWPPEIDIMEILGHQPQKVYFTFHWGTSTDHESKGGSFISTIDLSQDFHTYSLEWNENEMIWYLDGIQRFRTTQLQTGYNLPAMPFYLVLNTAIGGDWPGKPNAKTVFPQYHLIDYVRVYQKEKANMAGSENYK